MLCKPLVEDKGFRMNDSQGDMLAPGNVLYSKVNIREEVFCYVIFKENGKIIALLRSIFGTTFRCDQKGMTDSYWAVDKGIRTKITVHQKRIEAIRWICGKN